MSDISAILADLAAGRIDAAEAERRIAEQSTLSDIQPPMPPDESSSEWPVQPEPPADAEPVTGPVAEPDPNPPAETRVRGAKAKAVERVLVKANGRRVKIIGNPTVKQAMAEGVHQTKRRGNTLEISGEVELAGVTNAIGFLKSVRGIDDIKALGIGQELNVHVNPALAVDIAVVGGSIAASDVPRLGQVRLTAGGATLTGVAQVDDLLLQAGHATVEGRFAEGMSRLRVESGQLTVKVDPTSDVTVRADTRIGYITWETLAEHSETELVVGGGSARLDIGVVMGQATIGMGDDTAPEAPAEES